MITFPNIISECKAETAFVQYLMRGKSDHQHGIGNVLRSMMSRKLLNHRAIGIIDDDKIKPSKISEFSIKETWHQFNLKLLAHQTRDHFLIVISPAHEKWVLQYAEMVNVLPSSYQLPASSSKLKMITERMELDRYPNYKKFLTALENANPEPMDILRKWIREALQLPLSSW